MTTDTPEDLDEPTPHQLVDEVKQITEQYVSEVPGARRKWPKSIRLRIIALARLGVPKPKISELTQIPVATVFVWCKGIASPRSRRRSDFVELPKLSAPTVGVTSEIPTVRISPLESKFSIRCPKGFVFDGIQNIEELAQLYRKLSG